MVEFALILPVFLLLLLMAADFGRLFFTYVQVSNAAREAAAYGATQPTDNAGMQTRAAQEKSSQSQGEVALEPIQTSCANQAGTTISCAATPGGAGAGNTLTVTAQQRFSFLTPLINGFFGGNLTMSSSVTTAVLVSAVGGSGGGVGACAAPSNATFTVVSSGLDVTVNPDGSKPDTGVCTISGYNWDFGDGETDVGSSIPSTHTYASPGTYVITLEVTNQGGTLTAIRTVTVPTATPTPTPTPAPTPTSGPTPTPTTAPTPTPSPTPCAAPVPNFTYATGSPSKKVTFTDASTAPPACPITTWLWDFGDGSASSNAPNPVHTFPNNNTNYTVTLTVTSSAGVQTIVRTVRT
ncbi:MAG: PKD domain-containing protein [Candidatus Limnocylindrales bacterium]